MGGLVVESWEDGSMRTGTDSNPYANEGTVEVKTVDGVFAEEVSNVWFSRFTKEL